MLIRLNNSELHAARELWWILTRHRKIVIHINAGWNVPRHPGSGDTGRRVDHGRTITASGCSRTAEANVARRQVENGSRFIHRAAEFIFRHHGAGDRAIFRFACVEGPLSALVSRYRDRHPYIGLKGSIVLEFQRNVGVAAHGRVAGQATRSETLIGLHIDREGIVMGHAAALRVSLELAADGVYPCFGLRDERIVRNWRARVCILFLSSFRTFAVRGC